MLHKNLVFKSIFGSVAALCIFWQCNVNAELILTAPPRELPEAGEKLYGPLAEHLSNLLGEKVVYQHPQNWLQYQRDLRRDVYDIIFDGPHFASWRIEHLQHDVLLKLPGSLQFVIIVNSDDDQIKTLKDLIGKKICGIPPPNLATLSVIEQFQNPVRQPVIWGIRGGAMHVFRSFAAKECRAATFRTTFYEKKLSAQDRVGTEILFKSKRFPNQAISVSSRVDNKSRRKIILSLTEGRGLDFAKPVVRRFAGKKTRSFIKANNKDYLTYNQLLEGVIFGW